MFGLSCPQENRNTHKKNCGCQNKNNMEANNLGLTDMLLTGVVMDKATRSGLPAAHITNLTKVTGTVSGADGGYTLEAEPNDMIEISFVGYKSVLLPASEIMQRTLIGVESTVLDEVIVSAKESFIHNIDWWLMGAGVFLGCVYYKAGKKKTASKKKTFKPATV